MNGGWTDAPPPVSLPEDPAWTKEPHPLPVQVLPAWAGDAEITPEIVEHGRAELDREAGEDALAAAVAEEVRLASGAPAPPIPSGVLSKD